jgi:hypothetical protein
MSKADSTADVLRTYGYNNGWALWSAWFDGRWSDYHIRDNDFYSSWVGKECPQTIVRVLLDEDSEVIAAHRWTRGNHNVSLIKCDAEDKAQRVISWLTA